MFSLVEDNTMLYDTLRFGSSGSHVVDRVINHRGSSRVECVVLCRP